MAANPLPTPDSGVPPPRPAAPRLSPWEIVQLARHPQRPKAPDFIFHLVRDFAELHGDRLFRDDPALLAGIGWFEDQPGAVNGPYNWRSTKNNMLAVCACRAPIVVVITGEGGSGGALAMGGGDAVLMLQYAIYTVIPPEGCAAILWRDVSRAKEAAEALRLTAWDLTGLGIIDEIIPEPEGGAHQDPDAATAAVREALGRHLQAVKDVPIDRLLDLRYEKYRRMGRQMESLARG